MADSEQKVNDIVEKRLKEIWALSKIAWENIRFNPKEGTPFISLSVSENEGQRTSKSCTRRNYTVIIEIKVPVNSGNANINSYCDLIKTGFNDYSFEHFSCIKSYVQNAGKTRTWFQKNVVLNCKYTDFN